MLQKLVRSRSARFLSVAALAASSVAHAQATTPPVFTVDSLAGITAIVVAFIGIGVTIHLAMVSLKVGKRASNKV